MAGRFSSRVYGSVDNSGVNAAAYTGFQSFLVFDARIHYQMDKHWSMAVVCVLADRIVRHTKQWI